MVRGRTHGMPQKLVLVLVLVLVLLMVICSEANVRLATDLTAGAKKQK